MRHTTCLFLRGYFGPVSSGQYLRFLVNDERVRVSNNGTVEDLKCAPVTQVGDSCHRKDEFAPCYYNIPISRDLMLNENGGTFVVVAESAGVVSSACPYKESVIYVKYALSGPSQDTPSPTLYPTYQPTKEATNVVNGLQLDVNELDIWALFQIAIGVGVALAGGGVYLCKLREKSEKVYKHPTPFAVVSLGMLGMELTSMVFLVVNLFRYGYSSSGGALLAFRFLKMLFGVFILMGTFRPPKTPLLKSHFDFKKYLDQDHFVCESKVYFAVAFLCLIDLTFVVFLPWNDSRFATLSKGFPNIVVFRVVSLSLVLTAIISFIIQVSYLSTTTFSVERDLMFLMNIFLLGIKVILILLEFIYKNGKLGKTSTSIDEESSGQGDMEMGIQQPNGEEQIVYHHNPMINSENSEEKQPLLRRMDDVEHKTESIEAKTESIEAKR